MQATESKANERKREHRPARSKPKSPKKKLLAPFDAAELLKLSEAPLWNHVHDMTFVGEKETFNLFSFTKPSASAESEPEKLEVQVPKVEFGSEELSADQSYPIYVDDPSEGEEALSGSYLKGQEIKALAKVNHAYKRKKALPGFVVAPIKGGYSVALLAKTREEAESGKGLRAFLPSGYATLGRGESLNMFTEAAQNFRVRDYAPKKANIILSRKEVLLEEKKQALQEVWPTFTLGNIVTGTVKAIMPYGAFVDVGGVDAFVHVSDITWKNQRKTEELLTVGQTVDAKIIKLDDDNKKLKISIKDTQPDPWTVVKENYPIGSVVEGDVVALADFGVFLKIAEGIEGLIHVSEISWKRFKHPSSVFTIGQHVKAMVLDTDEKGRRIALSTKTLEKSPVERVSEKYAVGDHMTATISGIADFGLFVDLGDDVQGLVHIGEVSWTKRSEDLNQDFEVGQEIEVSVLGFDEARQRISCSIKKLAENPWIVWRKKYAVGNKLKLKIDEVISAGALSTIEPGLVAFCPTSHLTEEKVSRPQDVVKTGDTIDVVVTECSQKEKRLVVSVRQLEQKETQDAYKSYLKQQSSEQGGHATLGDLMRKNDNQPNA